MDIGRRRSSGRYGLQNRAVRCDPETISQFFGRVDESENGRSDTLRTCSPWGFESLHGHHPSRIVAQWESAVPCWTEDACPTLAGTKRFFWPCRPIGRSRFPQKDDSMGSNPLMATISGPKYLGVRCPVCRRSYGDRNIAGLMMAPDMPNGM